MQKQRRSVQPFAEEILIRKRDARFQRRAEHRQRESDVAEQLGLCVVRVPAYSPHAVAEHALALILTLNRRTHRAFNRTREGDFSLHGLTGFDLHGKSVGIIGAGQIGLTFARIMAGFGCQLLINDPRPVANLAGLGARQVELDELIERSDIISLHCPLNAATHHLINAPRLQQMKAGVMLINTLMAWSVITKKWNWPMWAVLGTLVPFGFIDGVFLTSNLLKIHCRPSPVHAEVSAIAIDLAEIDQPPKCATSCAQWPRAIIWSRRLLQDFQIKRSQVVSDNHQSNAAASPHTTPTHQWSRAPAPAPDPRVTTKSPSSG